MVSPTATSCTRRETGSRGTSPHETMNCPYCQTPMEDGLIDKSHWFGRKLPMRTLVINRFLLRLFAWCTVHPIIAHRCARCSRVELTAP